MERGRRKVRTGIVIGDKTNKTRIVEVTRTFRHTLFDKTLRRRSKLYAHDEKNETHVGDEVRIMESRPLSKLKRWFLLEIVKKA